MLPELALMMLPPSCSALLPPLP